MYTLNCPCGFVVAVRPQGQHTYREKAGRRPTVYHINANSTWLHYTSVSVLTCWSHECVGQYAPLAERRVVGEGCTWGPGEEH